MAPDFSSFNDRVSDIEFLRQKELDGDLIHLISAEFTTDAAQVTYTPATGKTFFHLKSALIPVTNTVFSSWNGSVQAANRRGDVELIMDSVVEDQLTHDFEAAWGSSDQSSAANAFGTSTLASKYESTILRSLVGNASKTATLTSTNTSGTFRVTMLGWIEDTI